MHWQWPFNTSRVRLEEVRPRLGDKGQVNFQYLKGAIRSRLRAAFGKERIITFNTSRVRLEGQGHRPCSVCGRYFQYLKGAIRRTALQSGCPAQLRFQYLKGAIRRMITFVDASEVKDFQYLKGAIRRASGACRAVFPV